MNFLENQGAYKRVDTSEGMNVLFTKILSQLVDKTVSVYATKSDRHSFNSQISIQGRLEKNTNDDGAYRVFVNDGSYCYFKTFDIIAIGVKPMLFIDGSISAIHISLDRS